MSLEAFRTDLYLEHFEEVAGLYDSRIENLDDLESSLLDVVELESRMEAHLDALELGGALALNVARESVAPDDPATLYAWVALACHSRRFDLVQEAFERLEAFCSDEQTEEPDAAAARKAVSDALVHAIPQSFEAPLVSALKSAPPHVSVVVATVVGVRRLRGSAEVAQAAQRPNADAASMMRALSRVGGDQTLLRQPIRGDRSEAALQAALGALRTGDSAALSALRVASQSHGWPYIPLALCNGAGLSRHLRAVVESGRGDEDVLLALGLVGDPSGIEVLRARLEDEAQAEAAAWSLFLLTGFGFVVPEPPVVEGSERPDEVEVPVTEEEYAAARANPEPDPEEDEEQAALDDEPEPPSGPYIERDPSIWGAWLDAHHATWSPGQRHRLGVVASALTDLEVITDPRVPLRLRTLLADEFVIRYGIDEGYEVDQTARRQIRAVQAARARVQSDALRFKPGAWYFQGQLIP